MALPSNRHPAIKKIAMRQPTKHQPTGHFPTRIAGSRRAKSPLSTSSLSTRPLSTRPLCTSPLCTRPLSPWCRLRCSGCFGVVFAFCVVSRAGCSVGVAVGAGCFVFAGCAVCAAFGAVCAVFATMHQPTNHEVLLRHSAALAPCGLGPHRSSSGLVPPPPLLGQCGSVYTSARCMNCHFQGMKGFSYALNLGGQAGEPWGNQVNISRAWLVAQTTVPCTLAYLCIKPCNARCNSFRGGMTARRKAATKPSPAAWFSGIPPNDHFRSICFFGGVASLDFIAPFKKEGDWDWVSQDLSRWHQESPLDFFDSWDWPVRRAPFPIPPPPPAAPSGGSNDPPPCTNLSSPSPTK